jgi:hypothetical protein
MKHFKDSDGNVYAYEADGSQDEFILDGLTAITKQEADALRAQPPSVPQSVTRFQARAALHLAGLLEQVEALMAHPDTPMLAKLAWADAMEFKRTSPTIASLASTLGLSDAALDDLFTVAAGIDA